MKQLSCLSSVCLSVRVRSRKLSEVGAKFRHLYTKLGSPSKNITSGFAPEVAEYSKITLLQQQFRECASLLLCSIVAYVSICKQLFVLCSLVILYQMVIIIDSREWCGAGIFICMGRDAALHMVQLMPLPLTVSCSSKSRLVLPFWYQLTWVVPDKGPLNGCLSVYRCS